VVARRLGIALLGAGRLGAAHARTLASLPEVHLTVIADPAPAARELGTRYGARALADPLEAIADREVEAVVIVTPTGMHAAQIEAAARARKAIFCEKPIALEVASTEHALAVVKECGVPLQIGFQRRYDTGFADARQRIAAGEIGRLHLLRSVSYDPYPPPPHYIPTCGGQFVDMTIHDIDVARFLTGSEAAAVSAIGAALGREAEAFRAVNDWDTTVLSIRFTSGALGSIVNSRQSGYGYDIHTEVLGDHGGLKVGYERHTPITRYDRTGAHYDYVPYFPERFAQAYAAELQAFVESVRAGKPVTPSGQDGLMALRIALAATESARRDGVWTPVR
jgi:myo-inositol 2-dehydrogenase / D-chiro-inositol 1-dehydrogenase